jgi:putative phosphoribosyl transferase
VTDKIVILVDDGLATGSTMRAAALAVRELRPAKIVVAVPVAAEETCDAFRDVVDEIVCGVTPRPFHAVGLWYDDFEQTSDEEVRGLLAQWPETSAPPTSSAAPRRPAPTQVSIPVADATLEGDLVLPEAASGIVVFSHGSGSSRHSPRNRRVAATLNEKGLGTLLLDLLTPAEEQRDLVTAESRFDIALLARRLVGAIDWVRRDLDASLPIGLFGASTGAAAALVAAAARPDDVYAVVSRGGRPDLAAAVLPRVRAPTLLIVGGSDPVVLELNKQALELLQSEKQLVVVPGATHLFEEPGALDQVARLAADWFTRHLGGTHGDR